MKADGPSLSSVPRQRPERLDGLTSIRFFFALMVVVAHFYPYHAAQIGPIPGSIQTMGSTAVSWFFVLSGFILRYNFPALPSGRDKFNFFVSRFVRLYPVHLACILISALLFTSTRLIIAGQPFDLISSLTLTHTWLAIPFTTEVFNVPAWSISVEWFFYLMFPLVVSRRRWISSAAIIVPVALGLFATTAHGCWSDIAIYVFSKDPFSPSCAALINYFPPSRYWEFLTGIGLCIGYQAVRPYLRSHANATQLLALLAAIAVFWWGQSFAARYVPFSNFAVSVWAGFVGNAVVGSLLIFAFAFDGVLTRALSTRWMIFGGEISYAMYMTHMLIIRWFVEHKDITDGWSIYAHFALVLALTVLLSSLLFTLVETPCRSSVKALLAGSRLRGSATPQRQPT